MKVSVIGSGSWGTALAQTFVLNGNDVLLWCFDEQDAKNINEKRENSAYFPGHLLPSALKASSQLHDVVGFGEILVMAVPSAFLGDTLQKMKPFLSNQIFVLASKGLQKETAQPLSVLITSFCPENEVVVLSGPSHAEEVLEKVPTNVMLASSSVFARSLVKSALANDFFKCDESDDVVGVQLGGALKNIIAVAGGISDGLGYGINTKSFLIAKGLEEMVLLGEPMGGRRESFYGIAGLGDLFVTCCSTLSRNWNAGNFLAQGKTKDQVVNEMFMVVEGFHVLEPAIQLKEKFGLELPVFEMVDEVVSGRKEVKESFSDFLKKCQ